MAKDAPKTDAERMARAEEYLTAAREHFAELQRIEKEPLHYPLAYYLAGLSAECLFRGYVELVGGKHDPKHDLAKFASAGLFLDFMHPDDQEEAFRSIYLLRIRWLNNHRYRSRHSLENFLKETELYRKPEGGFIKGDIVEYNWSVVYNSAYYLLEKGLQRWNISKNKWNKSF